jgi:arylsulfatase A
MANSRPNIICILLDDMGPGDISSCHPECQWETPCLDRMVAGGMRFTDAHSSAAICTPSRYTLLTGRYSWRTPLKRGVLRGYCPAMLEPERLTLPQLLREQGYTTAMFGKWHLGLDWVRLGPQPEQVDFAQPFRGGPIDHGFDEFYGISASLDMPPYVYLQDDRAAEIPTRQVGDSPPPQMWRAGAIGENFAFDQVLPTLEQKAVTYIANHAAEAESKPFFLYLPLPAPHTPIVPTPEFLGKSQTTVYGDFVLQVDAFVGKILDALAANGIDDNTLLLFTSDHGFAPAADLQALRDLGHDPCAGYRGHKADIYEGGHRVPFIARWPRLIPAGQVCRDPIVHADLMATCAEILDVALPNDAAEDSLSILPLLRGETSLGARRAAIVHHSENGSLAIRRGQWKLCLCPGSGGWSYPRPGVDDDSALPPFQLFNLASDPSEQLNLAASEPALVRELALLLRSLIERGRTREGPANQTDTFEPWPQIAWFDSFPSSPEATPPPVATT